MRGSSEREGGRDGGSEGGREGGREGARGREREREINIHKKETDMNPVPAVADKSERADGAGGWGMASAASKNNVPTRKSAHRGRRSLSKPMPKQENTAHHTRTSKLKQPAVDAAFCQTQFAQERTARRMRFFAKMQKTKNPSPPHAPNCFSKHVPKQTTAPICSTNRGSRAGRARRSRAGRANAQTRTSAGRWGDWIRLKKKKK